MNHKKSFLVQRRRVGVTSLRVFEVFSAVLATSVLALTLATVPAEADDGVPPTADSLVHKVSEAEAADAVQYWTPERMRAATPAEAPETSADNLLPERIDHLNPIKIITDPALVDVQVPSAVAGEQFTSNAVGKVFYYDQTLGRDRQCSASVINSTSKRVVVTAAHCVRGPEWHLNWVFVPAYNDGTHPFGSFGAFSIRVDSNWDQLEGGMRAENDVAFISTYSNRDGKTVGELVGGFGLTSGGGYENYVTILGYPYNLFKGEYQFKCEGMTHPDSNSYPHSTFMSIAGCNFGGGASGGPWLKSYDYVTGHGYVSGVTSFGPGDVSFISAPPFDNSDIDLFNAAEMDW